MKRILDQVENQMVKKKRGSGIDRRWITHLISKTIENNKTVFEILDEH